MNAPCAPASLVYSKVPLTPFLTPFLTPLPLPFSLHSLITPLYFNTMKKKEFLKFAVQTAINLLAAILTALGATSCVGSLN